MACLWDMRDSAREVARLVHRVPYSRIAKESMRRLALERSLELVGQAARKVSRKYQDAHPEIDWRGIIGQRNVLAHDYGVINHKQLYDTAREKIPGLILTLDRLIGDPEK